MTRDCDIGLIGLGVMGRSFLLNLADRGFRVAGYDLDGDKVAALRREGGGQGVEAAEELKGFVTLLRSPRAVMLLVPAGDPVDSVIQELVPHLAKGDVVVDGGNSFYRDTDRRMQALGDRGLLYLGMGVSGGEYGARHGPSMMPGGSDQAYERVRPMLEKAAAAVDGAPCVAFLGPGSAGHYVKLVHNGIEYGLMELIAECYDLMRRGLGLSNDELHRVFDEWNRGDLGGYLLEITAKIFLQEEGDSGRRLVDVILDRAEQKGTGKWTSQNAMDLGVP
ncbi:MAG: NADP-dependent phosphogluconate dehydrogenase, partial [Proteobacteria bacterium]|nr:NADP-dependent phosphogluconate dehydrogenase [Pseudomonadota bacterium]